MSRNNITLLIDSIFFYLIVSKKIISKTDKETEPIMALLVYIGLYFLLYYDYTLQYEVGLTVRRHIFLKVVAFDRHTCSFQQKPRTIL